MRRKSAYFPVGLEILVVSAFSQHIQLAGVEHSSAFRTDFYANIALVVIGGEVRLTIVIPVPVETRFFLC